MARSRALPSLSLPSASFFRVRSILSFKVPGLALAIADLLSNE
jgi:hypothetical protein